MLHENVFTLMHRVVGLGTFTQAFTFILPVAGEATFALTMNIQVVGVTMFILAPSCRTDDLYLSYVHVVNGGPSREMIDSFEKQLLP